MCWGGGEEGGEGCTGEEERGEGCAGEEEGEGCAGEEERMRGQDEFNYHLTTLNTQG